MTEGVAIDTSLPEHGPTVAEFSVVNRGWVGLVLGLGCLTFATIALGIDGPAAFHVQAVPGAVVPVAISGAVCAVIVAPLFLVAAELSRRACHDAARFLLAIGVVSLVLLIAVPRGPMSSAWYIYCAVTLLVAVGLGVGPGLVAVLTGVLP